MEKINGATIGVTGGCGFIGSHLIERLLELGVKKIISIDSLEYGKETNIPKDPRIECVKFKLGFDDAKILQKKLVGVDFIFHLAAEKHNQSKDSPDKVIQANIIGMQHLLQAATSCGVKKVVFSSSLYAYGRMSGPKFMETDLIAPQTVYGMTKAAGEFLLNYFHRQSGIEFNVLRYMFAYGPRQYANLGYKSVIVSNFQKIILGKNPTIYGDGKQCLDYIYVKDLVEGTILALTSDISGEIFNIGSSKETTVESLTAAMIAVAHSNLKPVYTTPDWTQGSYRVADTSKAQKMLGFSASTPIEMGLSNTFEWLIKNNTQS